MTDILNLNDNNGHECAFKSNHESYVHAMVNVRSSVLETCVSSLQQHIDKHTCDKGLF
mgnify:FL=1